MFGLEKYLKKLIGDTDIEDSLGKLDNLTQEEARMASAEQLRIAHSVEGKVIGVDEKVQGVGDDVQDVGKKVEDVNNRVQNVGDKVQGVDDKVQGIDSDMKGVVDRVEAVDDKVQGIDEVQGIHGKLDDTNRSSSLSFPTFHSEC